MNKFAFYNYDKREEEPNGEYYKFVSASDEELDNTNLSIYSFCEIANQVQNLELKTKMKARIINYLKGKDLTKENTYFLSLGLFDEEEIKTIISQANYIQKIQDILLKENINSYNIISFIRDYFYSSDATWKFNNISEILSLVKEYDFYESLLISTLERALKEDKELFRIMLNNYKSSLPQYYLNYLNINSDKYYLYNKSMEYRDLHLRIGIDPRITIAPEMEANNHNDLAINFYNQEGFKNKFSNYDDPTVPDGKEINCMPFHDTEEELAMFKAVCDSLRDIGYYYNSEKGNASGQINLGLSYLDSATAIINFYEIFGNVEELLFYISNKKGQLTRQALYQNSRFKPIGEIIGTRILDEDITRTEAIKLFNSTMNKTAEIEGLTYKKNTVCLRGDNESNYRFEVRIPNGGVDYETWIDNIRLYGKMMEVAKKLADASKKDELTPEEEKMLNLKFDLEDKSLSLKEKLDILMNLLFSDERIKNIYYDRFNSVVDRLNNSDDYQDFKKYYVPSRNSRIEPMFDEVEFQGKYESRLDNDPVVEYNPETNEYIENGERKHLR